MATDGQATVHLNLRGRLDDEAVTALRQQLSTCLSSGVDTIRVRVDEQPDLDLQVLQVLQGAADHLAQRGGSLTVHGVQPKALSRIRIRGLERLLPEGEGGRAPQIEPYPDAVPPAAKGSAAAERTDRR